MPYLPLSRRSLPRWVNLLLIGLTLVGCVAFVNIQRELALLSQEHSRIVSAVGEMEIVDPQLVHIKALKTDDPLLWQWRVYLPEAAKCNFYYSVGTRGSSNGSDMVSSRSEFIARIGLSKPRRGGAMQMFTRCVGHTGVSTFGNDEFADFLIEHRDQLKVEQLGSEGVRTIKAGEPAVSLLRVSLPDDLAREAQQRFTEANLAKLIPIVVEARLEYP